MRLVNGNEEYEELLYSKVLQQVATPANHYSALGRRINSHWGPLHRVAP